jgi:hypothetical protein
MMGWQQQLTSTLASAAGRDPKAVIDEIVEISERFPDEEWPAMLGEADLPDDVTRSAREIYADYIHRMERAGLAHALAKPDLRWTPFSSICDPEARTAYDRVSDLFDVLELAPGLRFTMIGCGELPVTAIHVIERAGCEVVCMDVVPAAITAAERLSHAFGWGRQLHPLLCDGTDYDYGAADIVYIANMVRPKGAVLRQVAATARRDCKIVLRDPYGLGVLWAEQGEASLPPALQVRCSGPGSRYLSRDLFLDWREGPGE